MAMELSWDTCHHDLGGIFQDSLRKGIPPLLTNIPLGISDDRSYFTVPDVVEPLILPITLLHIPPEPTMCWLRKTETKRLVVVQRHNTDAARSVARW